MEDIVNSQFLSEKVVKSSKIVMFNVLSVRLLKSFLLIIDELFKLKIGKQYTKYPGYNGFGGGH